MIEKGGVGYTEVGETGVSEGKGVVTVEARAGRVVKVGLGVGQRAGRRGGMWGDGSNRGRVTAHPNKTSSQRYA